MEIMIEQYDASKEAAWDEFVEQKSINGTFLQARRFLNYHGGKFKDVSLMFYADNNLVAVCPACEELKNEEKIFYSHRGSTYGGLIVAEDVYKTEKILLLIDELEQFLKYSGYTKCVLRPTMKLLTKQNMDLLDFCFYYKKYKEYRELNLYIDYQNYAKNTLQNFSHMKQRLVKKCIKTGITLQEITEPEEIRQFYNILEKNLQKFDTKPVHTYEELLDLYYHRIAGNVKFYGAYLEEKLLAGTMVFLFEKQKCAHTQYLAADPQYRKLSPMSFIYYSMARLYQELGYKTLSWGITTEHLGTDINIGLTNNKEAYGSSYMVNSIYEKYLV